MTGRGLCRRAAATASPAYKDVKQIKLNSVALVCKRTIPTDRRLSAMSAPTFADKGCRVVSATDPQDC
jgi:hypothetical protein